MSMRSVNPATEEVLHLYPESSPAEIEQAIQRADAAFQEWRRAPFGSRGETFRGVAQRLQRGKEEYGRLMAEEMGKPRAQGVAEVEKCAWVCEYFAEQAESFLRPQSIATEATRSFVTFPPLGVILAVMPWNFPFWQVFRCAAPALMAGNSVVLKHAGNVTGCALALAEIFADSGAPAGLFQVVVIESSQVARLIAHPLVRAVTLTGSVPAGQAIASRAGQCLKKTVLELGGSDPYLVLEDADLEPTVETCVASRLINSGQSCIAAKRFIVVEAIREQFEQRFVERMAARRIGRPMEEGVEVGPLARPDLRDQLHGQVIRSVTEGAKLLLGGRLPAGKGWFYPPTVLSGVNKGMPAFEEETFGPVAAIVSAWNEREAIRLANDSPFGLGAAVFTRDRQRGERIAAEELDAGGCFVNDYVRSDPRLPFGGVKQSGYGRELSHYGIREFVNIKTVSVN